MLNRLRNSRGNFSTLFRLTLELVVFRLLSFLKIIILAHFEIFADLSYRLIAENGHLTRRIGFVRKVERLEIFVETRTVVVVLEFENYFESKL